MIFGGKAFLAKTMGVKPSEIREEIGMMAYPLFKEYCDYYGDPKEFLERGETAEDREQMIDDHYRLEEELIKKERKG